MNWIEWASLIFLFTLAIVYFLLVLWDVTHDVKASPRTPMFLCDKHGAIPDKYVVHYTMDGILEKPLDTCPFCLEEKMKAAEKR